MCRRVASLHDGDGAKPDWACDGPRWNGDYAIGALVSAGIELPLPGPDAHWQGGYAYRRPRPGRPGALQTVGCLHIHADRL